MKSFKRTTANRWFIIAVSFVIVLLILWNTYTFFQTFKEEERKKVELLSIAQTELLEGVEDLDQELSLLTNKVLENNTTTPLMIVSTTNEISDIKNIDTTGISNANAYLQNLLNQFKKENTPIEIRYKTTLFGYIYYGNSTILNKLKYYPIALLAIIILFGFVIYFFYKSSKSASQNLLWSGMAKETAHQIGTPLSSLIGWTELLKTQNVNKEYILEIEKDIDRLKIITNRFSKIGSIPKLEPKDVVEQSIATFNYIKNRSSKYVDFKLEVPKTEVLTLLNPDLFSWALENIIKNGIDAMKGKGQLVLSIEPKKQLVLIRLSDTGLGISKANFRDIFKPGYTTKKRGWGLGLSLTKRIIEDFHHGNISVERSLVNKGTVILIELKQIV